MLMPQAWNRDRLAVGRQAAQPDQQPDEHRHRDGDRQRLRHERGQHAGDDLPRDALGDQLLAVIRERLNHQQEGEDDEARAGREG